jgi:transposase
MALPSPAAPHIPTETAALARQVCPAPTLPMQIRDALGPLYTDSQFAALFARTGRPAEAPACLALVCVLQFLEDLTDRQAADAVRVRIDWKYALGLPLDDPGFAHTVLTDFRTRLLAGGLETHLLSTLLDVCDARGWLHTRRQRTDATHVLAAIRTCSRSEVVGETLRAALNALSLAAPDWVQSVVPADWYARYARRVEADRRVTTPEARDARLLETGVDGALLLAALTTAPTPPWLVALPAVDLLRRVWIQQFVAVEGILRPRTADEQPPAALRIVSPYDDQARTGAKRATFWDGYKVHLSETVTSDGPQLITHVETAPAPEHDGTALPRIHQALAEADHLPCEHLLDAGYVDVDHLLSSRSQGIDLIGPVAADTSWQARDPDGFDVACFTIDWAQQQATCPQGQRSTGWYERSNHRTGTSEVLIRFAAATCGDCPVRARCTQAGVAQPRTLTVRPEAEHTALQGARARQETTVFKQLYAQRAGVEGTLSHGVRAGGLRRSRYRGQAKTHLQHLLVAVAINLTRLMAWLAGAPRATTRVSAFAALAPSAVPIL